MAQFLAEQMRSLLQRLNAIENQKIVNEETKADPYQMGYDAGENDISKDENPFDEFDQWDEHEEWNDGWKDGAMESNPLLDD